MQLQSGKSVVQVFSAEATQVKQHMLSPRAWQVGSAKCDQKPPENFELHRFTFSFKDFCFETKHTEKTKPRK